MELENFQISKKKIDRAGQILSEKGEKDVDFVRSLEIMGDWREAHKYPLTIFRNRLLLVAQEIDSEAMVAQRLKRLNSIVGKLKRNDPAGDSKMKLTKIQDIAGCRAILSNVEKVRKLHDEKYIHGKIKHERVKKDLQKMDYITYPKEDGYRSLHLVYKFRSKNENKEKYNGLLVEIQMRSRLQHLWSTAVETVDFFTGQGLKFNSGEKDWKDFFRLTSSAIALMEKCPIVPGTPVNKKELYSGIIELEKKLNLIKTMEGWSSLLRVFGVEDYSKDYSSYLLEIDVSQEKVTVTGFSKEKENLAIETLERLEKNNRNKKSYDVVLVGVDAIGDLKKAYSNYFADTKEFLDIVRRIIR